VATPQQPDLSSIDLLADSQDHGTVVPDSPALTAVSDLVAKWDILGGNIKRYEDQVALMKKERSEIEKELLPTAMSQANVSSFVTKSGRSVKIDEIVNGNIPAISTIEKLKGEERAAAERRRELALAVVHEKWPGLIKTELSVSLGKGETEVASQMAEMLRKQFGVTPSVDESIHPASLNSHFKQLKDDGKLEEIPVEPFALYVGPIAKIK
jgi:lipoate synthase